ncbi:MAG: hypothetical protein A6D92_03305 [Symbiobacterium thermophilum]|uniref:Uncharacterized protein n=1 Tax=Symbiobacterium thermophilum TaxID=2734 RepID=A0A1Y2T627_SYMTR|nr:MAG: hypothetical protein A6D92_03305 [Symbiobacterium thermophilum]
MAARKVARSSEPASWLPRTLYTPSGALSPRSTSAMRRAWKGRKSSSMMSPARSTRSGPSRLTSATSLSSRPRPMIRPRWVSDTSTTFSSRYFPACLGIVTSYRVTTGERAAQAP